MDFDWVMSCGLGWFAGPKFLLCDGLGLIESVVWLGWDGLKKSDPRTTLLYRAPCLSWCRSTRASTCKAACMRSWIHREMPSTHCKLTEWWCGIWRYGVKLNLVQCDMHLWKEWEKLNPRERLWKLYRLTERFANKLQQHEQQKQLKPPAQICRHYRLLTESAIDRV